MADIPFAPFIAFLGADSTAVGVGSVCFPFITVITFCASVGGFVGTFIAFITLVAGSAAVGVVTFIAFITLVAGSAAVGAVVALPRIAFIAGTTVVGGGGGCCCFTCAFIALGAMASTRRR